MLLHISPAVPPLGAALRLSDCSSFQLLLWRHRERKDAELLGRSQRCSGVHAEAATKLFRLRNKQEPGGFLEVSSVKRSQLG